MCAFDGMCRQTVCVKVYVQVCVTVCWSDGVRVRWCVCVCDGVCDGVCACVMVCVCVCDGVCV